MKVLVTGGSGDLGSHLVDALLQAMVSVSVDKLRRCLGYRPGQGEFLTGLIRNAVEKYAH